MSDLHEDVRWAVNFLRSKEKVGFTEDNDAVRAICDHIDPHGHQRGKIMDIEQLTIEQVKELQSLFTNTQNTSRLGYPIGQYVIIRSVNEGLNAGVLVQADETGCVLREARRLWRPVSKDRSMSWYEGVSISGLDEDSRVSAPAIQKIIVENYSITSCTAEAERSIREFATNETSC